MKKNPKKNQLNRNLSKALCLLMTVCTLSACSVLPSTESSEIDQDASSNISDAEYINYEGNASSVSSSDADPESNTTQPESTVDEPSEDNQVDTEVVIIDVEEVVPDVTPEDGTVLVRVNQDANVRDAPSSSNSNVVTTVEAGTELYAISSDEYWTCVIVDGSYYYIYTPFLDIVSGSFPD